MKLTGTASLARYFSAMLAVVLVVSGAARAEQFFSFDATPGKLPKTVVPVSCSIELRPDAESLALPGVEVIDIEVREPTARLTLNAVSTTFASVTVDDGTQRAAGFASCDGTTKRSAGNASATRVLGSVALPGHSG